MKHILSCLMLVMAGVLIFLGGDVFSSRAASAQEQPAKSATGEVVLDQSAPSAPSDATLAAPAAEKQPESAPTLSASADTAQAAPPSLDAPSLAAPDAAPPSLADSLGGFAEQQEASPAGDTKNPESSDLTGGPMPPPAKSDTPEIAGLDEALGGFEDPNANKKSDAQIEEEARAKALKGAMDLSMPLRPAEIRRLLEVYDETVQATETPIYPEPEPISTFTRTSLEPGTRPVVIKTAVGNVTTVSIVDMSGQPWPIQDLTWAGSFQVEQPERGSHMLRITPTSKFSTGNISLRLVGLNPPVIFTLRTERKSVHVRLDVQVPEMGPRGVVPPVDTPIGTKAGNESMTSVLMGVVDTKDTERLKVGGVDGRTSAYSQNGTVYVRTPYTLLSPAWTQSVQSADGMKVYALNYTPVLLLSDKGKMVRAYLSHKEQADGEY